MTHLDLSTLPESHSARNTPLRQIGAEYRNHVEGGKRWLSVIDVEDWTHHLQPACRTLDNLRRIQDTQQ